MVAIFDLVNFHRFKELEKELENAIPFFLITTMFQKGINKKITFNKHFARKYIRAYTMTSKIDPRAVRAKHWKVRTLQKWTIA